MSMFWKVLGITFAVELALFFVAYVTGISYGFLISLLLAAAVWLELSRNQHES